MKKTSLVAVVDDEESVCRALGRLIRSAGLDVETFDSGKSFLGSLASRLPAVVILDIHMPLMNGFEVQAFLKQENVSVPVVIITGHDSPESRLRAKANGCIAYMLKPVDDEALLRAVEDAVR